MAVGLKVEVHQNRFLGAGDRQMQAIVTVSAHGEPEPAGSTSAGMGAAEVLLVDCSSSMRYPPTKIGAARKAAAAAVSVLPDGTRFAVVRGTGRAELVYPDGPWLATASPETRSAATAAVGRLAAVGGTAMGAWLTLARELFALAPEAVRHAILLTDGRNESQSREELQRVLDACEGEFVCDARGIGDGWEPAELTEIVTVLRGGVDSVVRDEDLAGDFRALVDAALTKVVAEVRLRIGTMAYSRLRSVKQVRPHDYDLTSRCVPGEEGELVLSLGSWGAAETREYQLAVDLDQDLVPSYDRDRQLAWVEVDGAGNPPVPVLGRWTHDPVPPTLIHPKVLQYTVQDGLGQALTEGGDAYAAGDHAGARAAWGRAIRIATETGNEEILKRLRRIVEVVDAGTGDVLLRPDVTRSELLNLLISRVTHLGGETPKAAPQPDGEPLECPACGERTPRPAAFCEACREPLAEGDPA
ncbi:VWA domain-containing protein [Amycolatopsis sp. NBC_01480]|uniref:VWA domain-containing protein n=1 Tax=Amycolatopsis sp. NBC_01480 TaxID=2903562 RepID=UPI002E2B3E1A|nr:VWA domain-containing protein [Amycolatopsis sp. NBC_01480]